MQYAGNLIDQICCCINIRKERKRLRGVPHNWNYFSNGLPQIIFCGWFWERKRLWDILEYISDSYYYSCGHVPLHIPVVVKRRTNIPTWCDMMAPWCSVAKFAMYYHAGYRWCHRRFIKTIWTKKVGICWESWFHPRISKWVQGDRALGE